MTRAPGESDPPTVDAPGDVTALLSRYADGDESASEQLVERVYGELCEVARRQLRKESPGHTLDTGSLVNEAYLRLSQSSPKQYANRGHYVSLIGRVMKQVLIDHARAQSRKKRGGRPHRVELDDVELLTLAQAEQLLVVEETLGELEAQGERYRDVVELKVFVGLTLDEIAEVLEISPTTAKRDWVFARAWLNRALLESEHAEL